jgi:hypothetical protein
MYTPLEQSGRQKHFSNTPETQTSIYIAGWNEAAHMSMVRLTRAQRGRARRQTSE